MFVTYINYVDTNDPITNTTYHDDSQSRPSRKRYLIKHNSNALDDAYAFITRVKQRAIAKPNILIVDYSIYKCDSNNKLKLYDMRYIASEAPYR